jgi:hypothetical protein
LCLILCLLAPACLATSTPSHTQTPTLPEPDTANWSLALEDDFGDPTSGFADSEYAHGRWFYEDGRHGIEVTKQDWLMWSTQEAHLSDFALEVEVIAEESTGSAGVVFRSGEGGYRFYAFRISTDGSHTLEKALGKEGEDMSWETILLWAFSPHITTGTATNRLRVICIDTDMWLYANSNFLASARDESLASGEIGLVVGNPSEDKALLYFDDLLVYAPPDN